MKRARPYRWLALLPALAIGFGVPIANGVTSHVAGLPFLLAWIVGCVLLTSLVMAIVTALDARADADEAASRNAEANAQGRPPTGLESS